MNKSLALIVTLLGLAAVMTAKTVPVIHKGSVIDYRYQTAVRNMDERRTKHGLRVHRSNQDMSDQGGLFALMQGVAYGLQYSPSKNSACYNAISNSIISADLITSLLAQSYNPTTWPDLLLTNKEYIDMIAAVNANCAIDKLINTITQSLGEGAATLGARIGGASMFEIPNLMAKYKKADNNFEKGELMGKFIQILFNWSI